MTLHPTTITHHAIVWQDIEIEIVCDHVWLGRSYGCYLQITSVSPDREPLPITETGYKSHMAGQAAVDHAGGVEAYILAGLDEAATSAEWKQRQEQRRQYQLF